MTSVAAKLLRVGCHSDTRCGCVVARSFTPASTRRPAHTTQPVPALREAIDACQSCPNSQRHHAFWWLLTVQEVGRKLALRVGCQSATNVGFRVAKSLTPTIIRRPVQNGQPVPCTRFFMLACHSCSASQHHHTARLLPKETWFGVSKFRPKFHSGARSGYLDPRSLKPTITRLPEQNGHPTPRARSLTDADQS